MSSGILDKDGDPVSEPSPPPHRFGIFHVPEGCHIKGFGELSGADPRIEQQADTPRNAARLRD